MYEDSYLDQSYEDRYAGPDYYEDPSWEQDYVDHDEPFDDTPDDEDGTLDYDDYAEPDLDFQFECDSAFESVGWGDDGDFGYDGPDY